MAAGRLTDTEIRHQLLDFGENVGPVTPTTRPLLLKKLKKLQLNQRASPRTLKKPAPKSNTPVKGKKRTSPSRRLVGFSSDEEEVDSGSSGNRRQSAGRASLRDQSEVKDTIISSVNESWSKLTRRRSDGRAAETTLDDDSIDLSQEGEFSDTDSNSYIGPFQRGGFRFRSFRRKKEGSSNDRDRSQFEADKVKLQEEKRPMNSDSQQYEAMSDKTDGGYRRTSALLNALAVLLVVACIAMLIMYAFGSLQRGEVDLSLAALPLCNKEGTEGKGCQPLASICDKYANYLYDTLATNAGLIECEMNDTEMSKSMSKHDLAEKIRKDNSRRNDSEVQKIVSHTLEKIDKNGWGLSLFDKNGNVTEDPTQVQSIEAVHSIKPILCRIKNSFSKLVNRFILAALAFAVILGIYFLVRRHWRKEEEDVRLMYMFVENIIDILRKHHNACKTDKDLPPYLPIPHVRDMLIKPENRQKFAKTWHRAVRFLSANESRIRVESQRIAGEDFEVWRWIHITSPRHQVHKMALLGNRKGKCWQGQAFENFQWTVNPPIISPTPCLKIRNMFDPDVELQEGWHVIIQDAILEKCSDASNIVHIAVDKNSAEGCVYVKCDSNNSAGIAFKCLHGCWFDGRLVAVKYLTLKRYHQRFPMSLHATEPLRPSGTSPSSLVTFNPEDEDEDNNDSDIEV